MDRAALLTQPPEKPGFLERVFSFVGSPGDVVRSLIAAASDVSRGRPESAGRRLKAAGKIGVQFGSDLTTFGWLVPGLNPLRHEWALGAMGATKRQQGEGSIVTRDERLSFTDLMRATGNAESVPKSGLGRFGADLVGGVLTDPLSFLSFGGGGVAKGGLTGLGAVGAEGASIARGALEHALLKTTKGAAALRSGRTVEQLALNAMNEGEALAKIRSTWARMLAEGGDAAEMAARGGLVLDEAGGVARVGQLTGDLLQSEFLDAGVRALERGGLLPSHYALKLVNPITQGEWAVLGSREAFESASIWRRLSTLTAPGLAHRVLAAKAPDLTKLLDDAALAGWDSTLSLFAGKAAKFDPTTRALHYWATHGVASRIREDAVEAVKAIPLPPELERAIGEEGITLSERIWRSKEAALAAGNAAPEVTHAAFDDLLRQRLAARGFDALAVDAAVRKNQAWRSYAREMLDAKVELGILKPADKRGLTRDFYFPHQANQLLEDYLAAAANPAKVVDGVAYGSALRSVFDQARGNTLVELVQKLNKVAQRYELPVPPTNTRTMTEAVGDVLETDLSSLWLRYGFGSAQSMGNALFVKEAAKLGHKLDDTVAGRYLAASLEHLGPREGLFQKILGGGEVVLPGKWADAARAVTNAGKWTARGAEKADGTVMPGLRFAWPGLNAFFKAPLTLTGMPSFYTRNAVSNVAAAALDPDLGARSVFVPTMAALVNSMRDLILLRPLKGSGTPAQQAIMLRAARHEALSTEQLQQLAGLRFGKTRGDELARAMREGLTQGAAYGERELIERLRDLPTAVELIRNGDEGWFRAMRSELSDIWSGRTNAGSKPQQLLETYRALFKPMVAINDTIEAATRSAAVMHLVRRGMDPKAAIEKVNRHFVDYRYQNGLDRFVRDVIPFWRYGAGMTPAVLEAMARRPGAPINQLFRSAVTGGNVNELPPDLRQQFGVPLGVDREGNRTYATSFGLPFEAALGPIEAGLGLLGGETRPAQRFAAGMSPVLRAPFEFATGRSLYTGEPIKENTQARGLARLFAKEVELPGGRVSREVPWWVNHWAIGAMPWSRANSELEKWFDERPTRMARLFNVATGVKVKSVDEEKVALAAVKRYLAERADRGEVGRIEEFFARGGNVDAELKQALRQVRALKKELRR